MLLTFGEIVTFRLSLSGGQGVLGIRPDLTTLGNVIGGGLPIGAFGGRAEILAQFDPRRAGRSRSPARSTATRRRWSPCRSCRKSGPIEIERINGLGDRLRSALQSAGARVGVPLTVTGAGSLARVQFTDQPVRDELRPGDVWTCRRSP